MLGRKAIDPGVGKSAGLLKLPNGRSLTGQSHDYKRRGTTTLFAALEVATDNGMSRCADRGDEVPSLLPFQVRSSDQRSAVLKLMTRIGVRHCPGYQLE